MDRPFVIGICGGSSSGKTTVANMIKTKLKNEPCILNLIDFYLPIRGSPDRKHEVLPDEEARIEKEITEIDKHYDFDVPSAIDWPLLIQGLTLLKDGKPFEKPVYEEHLKQRRETTETVSPTDLIILEGHLIFTNKEVMSLLDLKVYIDTDDDVRLSRRVLKMTKKGLNLSDLLYKYEKQIKPAYELYIEPSKKYADMIIPNYGFSIDGLDINQMTIPMPAVDLIIKQVQTRA
jgi:uridine kinase